MDISKVKKILPDCELSEIRPCTTPGKVQFHLLVKQSERPTAKVLDVTKLEKLMHGGEFKNIVSSKELGVVKANLGVTTISILASGRVVVRKAENEEAAQKLLEDLAPTLKQSLF